MTDYLARLQALPPPARWAQARTWLFGEPLPFFAEMRATCPVLVLPQVTLAFRHADCTKILRRHDVFGVDLYKPKQGDYFMAQDDTAAHWREKSIMKAILDVEDVPAIRSWVGAATAAALAAGVQAGRGEIEAVAGITRAVPTAMVQHWFGFDDADPARLIDWSYWNQQDAFWNQPFDAAFTRDPQGIIEKRQRAGVMMGLYLAKLVGKKALKVKFGSDAQDPVSRLLRLAFSGGLKFDVRNVIFNTGGLLIGAVETSSHTVVNAVEFLLADPVRLAAARAAAATPALFDGHVHEALRFRPAFPYFFRTCHRPAALAAETAHAVTVPAGATVLAVTHSAMFDPAGYPDPATFDPGRDHSDNFTFGQGLHDCLGLQIARVTVPETVRQILLRPGLAAPAPPDYRGGRVPESWTLRYAA